MGTAERKAMCSCGQLTALARGEPVRVSICHCTACQRRTGSPFGAQARFPEADVTVSGHSSAYPRAADSGHTLTFHFCPSCGATVWYTNDALPGFMGIPLGAFAGAANDWEPAFSVYERSRHRWVQPPAGAERSDE